LENRPALFASRTNWNLTPNPLSEALAERRAAGKSVLDLTASNPTECGFAYDAEAILAALQNPAVLSYAPDPCGLLAAREAVCAYYASRSERLTPDSLILATSTSEAYSFVFRLLCEPGDEVLVPQPSYPLLDFLADLHDVKLVRYPLLYDHGWQIDFHALHQVFTARTRAAIVVNPNNPTGNFCKAAEIAELNDICGARGMAIIADEVFLDYSLLPEPPRSFVTNNSAPTFTMSGLSKIAGLPQFKASWLAVSGPVEWKRDAIQRLEVIADTFLSMNAPVQHAMPKLVGLRLPFQEQIQARVRENLTELDRQLAAQRSVEAGSCARLEVEGGWYAVLTLSAANCSSEEVALRLLTEGGVYVHPGHFYELAGDRSLVVSLITPLADFAAGVRRLLDSAG
jgi:alanine-synthesizing transaminase